MKSEDIVIPGWRLIEIYGRNNLSDDHATGCRNIAEAQAKVSFETGYNAGHHAATEGRTPRADLEIELADKEFASEFRKACVETDKDIYKAGVKEGRGEVFVWLLSPCLHRGLEEDNWCALDCLECWREKKEEWGIEY